jgi:NAD(P)-dependent dehydrogenase (short-subunit alcohol dehydrogenase family)
MKDRTVIVTGAGSGIGRSMVELFVERSARVVAVDIAADRLDDLPGSNGEVVRVGADVGTASGADEIVAAAGGRIDVLCNNAGILDGIRFVDEVDEAEWDRVIDVNLKGPYLLCHRVVPMMVAQGGGAIVNTASLSGLRGARAGAAYTASKFGVVGLTYNIAATFGPQGVRCNAICPGGVETQIMAGQDLSERARALVTRDRAKPAPAKPVDVAEVAVFLASDAARHVNGVAIPVDAGTIAY